MERKKERKDSLAGLEQGEGEARETKGTLRKKTGKKEGEKKKVKERKVEKRIGKKRQRRGEIR